MDGEWKKEGGNRKLMCKASCSLISGHYRESKTTTALGCIVMLYFAKFKIPETKLIAIDSTLTLSKVLLNF